MSNVFQQLADAVAQLMGVAPVTCSTAGCGLQGFVLGFVVIVVLTVGMAFLLGDMMRGGMSFMMPVGIAIVMVVLVQWWPIWTVIFIGLVLVFIIFNPFKSGVGGV